MPELNDFRKFHNAMRRHRRAQRMLSFSGSTYVRPMAKTIKGKLALKAAKRERVHAMKAAQQAF